MKKSRLYEMTMLLMEKKSITAAELARHFEVSQRTVYRDVDSLSAAGIPVYAQKGTKGGIRIMEGFVLERALLDSKEQDELLLALQCLKATHGADGSSALSHMKALFNREQTDWLKVDLSGWGESDDGELFDLIKSCILSRRVLCFSYFGSNGERTERFTEPVKLLFKAGSWYMSAWCRERGAERLFKLNRMEGARSLNETFERRPVASVEGQSLPVAVNTIKLVLRFAPEVYFRVIDCFSPSTVKRGEDGYSTVEVEYPDDDWVRGFLLSFGSTVEVLSPPLMQKELLAESGKISALYNS